MSRKFACCSTGSSSMKSRSACVASSFSSSSSSPVACRWSSAFQRCTAQRSHRTRTRVKQIFSANVAVRRFLSGLPRASGTARLDLTEFEVPLRRSCHWRRCRHLRRWCVARKALRGRYSAEKLCYVLRAFLILLRCLLPRHTLLCGTKEGSENFFPRCVFFCLSLQHNFFYKRRGIIRECLRHQSLMQSLQGRWTACGTAKHCSGLLPRKNNRQNCKARTSSEVKLCVLLWLV
jgi:hypothetical protein